MKKATCGVDSRSERGEEGGLSVGGAVSVYLRGECGRGSECVPQG